MSREILFKAKRINNGEWVEGYIFKLKGTDRYYIFTGEFNVAGLLHIPEFVRYGIIPETICQYTGLTDKNGNKIWENDIVKCEMIDIGKSVTEIAKVEYSTNDGGYIPFIWKYDCDGCDLYTEIEEIEVIGNIFDNPELLEGGAEE